MPFSAAAAPEVLRAAQKDEEYAERLGRDVNELRLGIRFNFARKIQFILCVQLSLALLGPRIWMKLKPHLESASLFAYQAATTLSDYQTLGEEYAGILQVYLYGYGVHHRYVCGPTWVCGPQG